MPSGKPVTGFADEQGLFADSRTHHEIKINGGVTATLLLMFLAGASGWQSMLIPLPLLWTAIYISTGRSDVFMPLAAAGSLSGGIYYGVVYPAALIGACRGFISEGCENTLPRSQCRGKECGQIFTIQHIRDVVWKEADPPTYHPAM
jgi:hypothetical protein